MLPFGVTIPATVPLRSEIPEGLMNYPEVTSVLEEYSVLGLLDNEGGELHCSEMAENSYISKCHNILDSLDL